MSKKMCKDKAKITHKGILKYVCEKCKNKAHKEKHLCKPVEIKPQPEKEESKT